MVVLKKHFWFCFLLVKNIYLVKNDFFAVTLILFNSFFSILRNCLFLLQDFYFQGKCDFGVLNMFSGYFSDDG